MTETNYVYGIGEMGDGGGMSRIDVGGDGRFRAGRDGVQAVWLTGDRKVELIAFAGLTLAYVRSEPFWVWIIQSTIAELTGNRRFELEDADGPHVSGHSVSEHLQYCIDKYCQDKKVEDARRIYFAITRREMDAILAGGGRADAFVPSPGLKEFLTELKGRGIKIAVVTSGLREKAWPEIVAAFRTLGMGDPLDFYDAIVTAGDAIRPGQAGTLGELEAKPHPWLYAEVARVGLGIEPGRRARCIGIEDSGAGICSIRLAGFAAVGIEDGNIARAGVGPLVHCMKPDLLDVLELL